MPVEYVMIYTKWVSCSIVHLQMRLIIIIIIIISIIIIIILTSCRLLSLFVVFSILHFLLDFLDVGGGLKISQERKTMSQVQYEKKKECIFLISEHVNLLL